MKIAQFSNLKKLSTKQQGFSLVELMVATAISIIVLLAASSTFLTTYKLKEEVKTRISYEQDVRNAANVIRSDMRQLGDFSCMNPPTTNQLDSIFVGAFTASNNKQYLSTDLNYNTGVTPVTGSKPLVLTYINDKKANNVLSAQCKTNIQKIDENVSGAVYIVGRTSFDSNPGFYRINYNNKVWSAPQLVVSNVTGVKYDFFYDAHDAKNCPSNQNSATNSTTLDPKISYKTDLDFNFDQPPVLIRTTLTIKPNGANNNSSSTTLNYEINAFVQHGEVCVSREV